MANQYINAMTAVWNSVGTTYAGIKMNVTNAASAAGSKLLQLQIGAIDKFSVDKNGNVVTAGTFTGAGIVSSAASTPVTNDGAALGSSVLAWSDLYLAAGGIINWNVGDVTITHSTNGLGFGGASGGYTFDAAVLPATNDVGALGSLSLAWSDLFLATGAVVNFASSDVTITHSTDTLTLAGGDLRLSSPGTNTQSVATLGGTQTLTAKTLTSPSITTPTITNPIVTDRIQIQGGVKIIELRVNSTTGDLEVYQGTTKIAVLSTAGKLQVNGDIEAFAGLV